MAANELAHSEELAADALPSLTLSLETDIQQQDLPSSPTMLTPTTEDEVAASNPNGAAVDINESLPAHQEVSEYNDVQDQEVTVTEEDASTKTPAVVNVSAESGGGDTDEPENCPVADLVEPSAPNDAGLETSAQEQSGPSDGVSSRKAHDDVNDNENEDTNERRSDGAENENKNDDNGDHDDTKSNSSGCACSTCRAKEKKEDSIGDEDKEWTDRVFGDDPEKLDGPFLDDSPARLEWLRQKREENEENKHLDCLMAMAGHENVKKHFLAIKERVAIAKRWNEDMKTLKLDLILHGKNGTGKKRIAQLYAEFLYSIGAVTRRRFTKTSGYVYPPDNDSTIIFFANAEAITAAYEMDSILEKVRKAEDNIVLIFSYRELGKDLQGALWGPAEARQRFPSPIVLEDYNESEIARLAQGFAEKHGGFDGGMGPSVLGIWARRLARQREREGAEFSLIDSTKNEAEKMLLNQANRFDQEWVDWARENSPDPDDTNVKRPAITEKQVTCEDILGPKPEDMMSKCEAWEEIQDMVGIESAKKEITHLFDLARFNYQLEAHGKRPLRVPLNRCFLGDPGVGKTTVAELYAKILAHLGLVSRGHVVLKNPSDLLGKGAGDEEVNTREALNEAEGGVLIIDDAHMLYDAKSGTDSYRGAIIDTLVANISGNSIEDRCVLLVGYPERMEQMFVTHSPGLRRRFPLENNIKFESYNDDQLCQIMNQKMAKDNFRASESGMKVAREVMSRMRTRPNFGNGGDVENLLALAKFRQRERLEKHGVSRFTMHDIPLEPQDFDPDHDRSSRADDDRNNVFRGFIGYDNIIAEFRNYQKTADGMRKYDIDPRPYIPWAFVFKGPPGTGKTSTARSIGKLFYNMGFLSSSEVVVCSATDLIGEYIGQTGPKVIKHFELGLGKVLFIDEAYRLAGSRDQTDSFHDDAIGEIVDSMTNPRYLGNMVVILAGYDEDMERLLQANLGLRSRFPKHISFPHLTAKHCIQLLKQELAKLKIDLPAELEESTSPVWRTISEIFLQLRRTKGWANGRDVVTLAKEIIGRVFARMSESKSGGQLGKLVVSSEELASALMAMVRERVGKD